MANNLCWICICPASIAKRLDTQRVIPIPPKAKCPDCGNEYDKVNSAAWEQAV